MTSFDLCYMTSFDLCYMTCYDSCYMTCYDLFCMNCYDLCCMTCYDLRFLKKSVDSEKTCYDLYKESVIDSEMTWRLVMTSIKKV